MLVALRLKPSVCVIAHRQSWPEIPQSFDVTRPAQETLKRDYLCFMLATESEQLVSHHRAFVCVRVTSPSQLALLYPLSLGDEIKSLSATTRGTYAPRYIVSRGEVKICTSLMSRTANFVKLTAGVLAARELAGASGDRRKR